MSLLSRLVNVFRRDRLNQDLEDEAAFHREQTTQALIRSGVAPADAFQEARRLFGRQLQIRESSRDAKLLPWLEALLQDVRFGFRILRKERAVTLAAVLSLSLAIGACTAAFSLIDALLLRPLPVPKPRQLIELSFDQPPPFPGALPQDERFSYPFLERVRRAAGEEADLFGITVGGVLQAAAFDNGSPEKLRMQWISGNGLGILGIKPFLGRLLSNADEQPDPKRSVAVLSYGFWKRRFGADPAVLGQWFAENGTRFQIVGVAQKGFSGLQPGYLNDIWAPLTSYGSSRSMLNPANEHFAVEGRLKTGSDRKHLEAVYQAVFTNFRRDHLDQLAQANRTPERVAQYIGTKLNVRSGARGQQSLLRLQFERPLWILAAVAGLILLIACANVANLLIARGAARNREMAMRAALGGGRMRLIQQLLIESSLISVASSILGLGIAAMAAPALVRLMTIANNPTYLDVHTDTRMLGFLIFIGLFTTLLFGLAPALRASALNPIDELKSGDGKHSARSATLRPALAAQVAFSFVVLFVAGLLLISFQKLIGTDLGFKQKNVLIFNVEAGTTDLPSTANGRNERAQALQTQVLDRLRQIPDVRAAATSSFALMGGATTPIVGPPMRLPGRQVEKLRPQFLGISPGFFATMQIPLVSGRDFTDRDGKPEVPTAAIVNQAFARQFFPGTKVLGKRFKRMIDDDGHFGALQIVGVVGDAKYNNLREPDAPAIYQPLQGMGAAVEVRTANNPFAIAERLRREIQRTDSRLRVTGFTLQSKRTGETIIRERMLALLAGFFAVIALVLVVVGLYGVLSYSVVRRTREIGIRVALGAPMLSIVRTLTAEVAATLAIGVMAGLLGGFAIARLLTSLLFEVTPADFTSIVYPLAALLLASGLAALAPALRAARTDPALALRYE